MASSQRPFKPPRGIKYGKDEPSSGFLVNVIKTLEFSETAEERQNEKLKIEKEFKKADLRLNELVSEHDKDLTRILPLFSHVSSQIISSRQKIHATKENLLACKQLLQCRRDELKKLWTDAVQQKYVFDMLEQINDLRKIPTKVTLYINNRQYLHATTILTSAISKSEGQLKAVEGLNDLRMDLHTRKNQLYSKLHEELSFQIYQTSTKDILGSFQRQNSGKQNDSNNHFQRNFARRSTDRAEANARVRKALVEMAQGFNVNTAELIEDNDLIDPDLSVTYFISIIVECFAMINKIPESIEEIKCKIQTELLDIVKHTTAKLISQNDLYTNSCDVHPVLRLLEMVFKQFKTVAQIHLLLLKNLLNVCQKCSIKTGIYDLTDYWQQAQQVLQLLLKDYLDIENSIQDDSEQPSFSNDAGLNINLYFSRRKVQSKRTLFKFDKSSTNNRNQTESLKDISPKNDFFSVRENKNSFNLKVNKKKVLVCDPDQAIITKIYLQLMVYIQEIENFTKCKSGQPCSLNDFIANFVKETFLAKGHNRNLQITIDSLTKNQEAWRSITSADEMKLLNLSRPLLQSTVLVERRIAETKNLIQDLPHHSEDLLKMVCSLLKTYRETCQAAYRGIVQPDSEDKRIYSVAWLKDEDISRFLKTLPNWTDLKSSNQRAKQTSRKLQRGQYEPSEEESPTQVQTRNIREAEMLTSNLGEGGISQQEILSDITTLKELAILQESMEWFSSKISEFANDLRKPILNGICSTNSTTEYTSISIQDGTIKVLTNLALEFDELANTCLLVLHLEVRVQCFHYLRTNPKTRGKYLMNKDDILEPDGQVLKLTKVLQEMDEAFSSTLHPRKTRYIFEGLAHLASRILIQASNYLENIDQTNIQRMCRNSLALQKALSIITASREVALDQAKNFYELLCMEPEEILVSIVERGSQFTEMQYLNALQLSSKSRGIDDLNSVAMLQQKLSDILGSKPAPGIVV